VALEQTLTAGLAACDAAENVAEHTRSVWQRRGATHSKLCLLAGVFGIVRDKQADVTPDLQVLVMHWSSLGLIGTGIFFAVLMALPLGWKMEHTWYHHQGRRAAAWYVWSHWSILSAFVVLACVFWRRFLVRERLEYSLRCIQPYVILSYVLLNFAVSFGWPEKGFEESSPVAGLADG
jgi:hypothetical protein